MGKRRRFDYIYDFGDSWLHRLTRQRRLPMLQPQHYTVCTARENTCPLEDLAGIRGYHQFLEIFSDPGHEEHEGMLDRQTQRSSRSGAPSVAVPPRL